MVRRSKINRYTAFNQTIISDLNFPELPHSFAPAALNDIHITLGKVPLTGLSQAIKTGPFFQFNAHEFWLNIPHIARFLVLDGQQIIVEPDSHIDEASVRMFILENCFKALLNQQHHLILEGTAIEIDNAAILFVMPSGLGKSTLASLFLKKGYRILSDEICAIRDDLTLLPAYPSIHLWSNIANQLAFDITTLNRVRPAVEKYRLDLEKSFVTQPLPVNLIYCIDYHKQDRLLFETIQPAAQLDCLVQSAAIPAYFRHQVQLSTSIQKLLADIPMIKLTCPRWKFNMDELGYLLEDIFNPIAQDMKQRVAYG